MPVTIAKTCRWTESVWDWALVLTVVRGTFVRAGAAAEASSVAYADTGGAVPVGTVEAAMAESAVRRQVPRSLKVTTRSRDGVEWSVAVEQSGKVVEFEVGYVGPEEIDLSTFPAMSTSVSVPGAEGRTMWALVRRLLFSKWAYVLVPVLLAALLAR